MNRTRDTLQSHLKLLTLCSLILFAGCGRSDRNVERPESESVTQDAPKTDLAQQDDDKPATGDSQPNPGRSESPAAVETLESLGCWFTKSGGQHIFMGYPQSHQDGRMSDDDFRHVGELPNLRQLQLSKEYKRRFGLTAEAFQHIRRHPQLRQIVLSGVADNLSFDDTLFDSLAEMPQLTVLVVKDCQLKGDPLQHLAQVTKLKSLSLRSSQFENADWSSLRQLEHLETLDLQLCNVGDDDLEFLTDLKKLRQIDLYGNHQVTRESLKILQQLPELESLTLTHTGIAPLTLDDVAAFPKLRKLDLLDVQPAFTRAAAKTQFPHLDLWLDD